MLNPDQESPTKSPIVKEVCGHLICALQHALKAKPLTKLKLILAVSGGEDSMVLLHALTHLGEQTQLPPIELIVCHVNHKLRPSADNDAIFVEKAAKELGLKYSLHVANPETKGQKNIEAWAREVRYNFLNKVLSEESANFILTAHHESDLTETLLFRLITGRLATSAHTMAIFDEERAILRPLLYLSKASIEDYSVQNSLQFIFDESNDDIARTRNRLRHQLVPMLASSYNQNVNSSIALVAERLNNDETVIEAEVKKLLSNESIRLIDSLSKLPLAYRWRIFRRIIEIDIGEDANKLGYKTLKRLALSLEAENPSVALQTEGDLGFGIKVSVSENKINFTNSSPSAVLPKTATSEEITVESLTNKQILSENFTADPSNSSIFQTPLDDQEENKTSYPRLRIPGKITRVYDNADTVTLKSELIKYKDLASEDLHLLAHPKNGKVEEESVAFFDYEPLKNKILRVRERNNGDLVNVVERGRRKLKKLLQENGLKLSLRDRLPLLELESDIIWVPAIARSSYAIVSPQTEEVLRITYRRSKLSL